MPHMNEATTMTKELSSRPKKEDKRAGKIRSINISVLDDGNFHMENRTHGNSGELYGEGSKSKTYAFTSVADLLSAIKDDLTTPHLKVDKDDENTKTKVKNDNLSVELKNYPGC